MDKIKQNYQLAEKAVESLNQQVGINAQNRLIHFEIKKTGDAQKLILKMKGLQRKFTIWVTSNVSNTTLGNIVKKMQEIPDSILVTHYVNPNIADKLRSLNIQFVDNLGNAYINQVPLILFIKGMRPTEEKYLTSSKIFSVSNIKIIFLLLCFPDLLQSSYRIIAQKTGLSLGAVSLNINQLIELGYLIKNKSLKLLNKEKLIDRWIIAYSEQLRPKLKMGTFKAEDPFWWKELSLVNYDASWGGEVAAAKLTNYIKPSIITIYSDANLAKLKLDYRLKPDPTGDVEIIQSFWKIKKQNDGLVSPLLVYADLMASGSARNIEVAKVIYEKYFDQYLK